MEVTISPHPLRKFKTFEDAESEINSMIKGDKELNERPKTLKEYNNKMGYR